jgi:hypothetical protein
MAHYRIYFMNTGSGHIDTAGDLEAPDDQAAIDAAARQVQDKPIELWREHRKVHRFEARPASAVDRYRSRLATQGHEIAWPHPSERVH